MADKVITLTGRQALKTWIEGKSALDSDLDALSDRVDDIVSEGGEPNVIEVVQENGTPLTITNKTVDIAVPTAVSELTNDSGYQTASDVSSAISTAVSSAYIYKGSVANQAALPASDNTIGDVYDVQDTGMNYAWNGSAWDALGTYVDTSVLWTMTAGQSNTLEAATVAEINAILEPSASGGEPAWQINISI